MRSKKARDSWGARQNLAKDPVVAEAFGLLKQATDHGDRIHVRDLGELLYLVTHVTFTKSRLASVLKVVDPVYDIQYLDELQCQFVVERVRNVLRTEDLHAQKREQRHFNFHLPGELETPDFECNCLTTSTMSPCCVEKAPSSSRSAVVFSSSDAHRNGTSS